MKSIFITEEVNEGGGGRIAEFTLRFSSPLNDYRKNLSVARSLIKLSCSSSFFRVTCCMILLTFKQINHYMFWCEFRCALANIIFILHPFYLVWCYTCASLVFACRRAKKSVVSLLFNWVILDQDRPTQNLERKWNYRERKLWFIVIAKLWKISLNHEKRHRKIHKHKHINCLKVKMFLKVLSFILVPLMVFKDGFTLI